MISLTLRITLCKASSDSSMADIHSISQLVISCSYSAGGLSSSPLEES